MPHILISYKDNFSVEILKELKDIIKSWYGLDDNGVEQVCTNDFPVRHLLIQNCSQVEFKAATTAHPVQYRVVENSELTKPYKKLQLDISKVL